MIDIKQSTLDVLEVLKKASQPACKRWGKEASKIAAYSKASKPIFATFNEEEMRLEFGDGSFDQEFSTNGKPWVNSFVNRNGAYRQ